MATRWCLLTGILVLCFSMLSCGGGTSLDNGNNNLGSVLVTKGDLGDGSRGVSDLVYPFQDPTPDDKQCWDLIAGQNMYAGQVCIWNDGDTLYVEYDLDNGFEMSEAHVYVGSEPPSKGNPGQFPYSEEFDPPVDSYTFEIPLDWAGKSKIYVATHAAAGTETLWGGRWNDGDPTYEYGWAHKWGGYFDLCVAPVPDLSGDTFTYRAYRWVSSDKQTFWDIVFQDTEPDLPDGSFMSFPNGPASYFGNDVYWGWCVDHNHAMYSNHDYDVKLFSTYDPNIEDPCDDPHLPILTNGNWDFVNFMINQRHNPDPGGPWDVTWNGTYRDQMEEAIWYFTNGKAIVPGSISEDMVNYAIANGDNFVPCEGDWYGIVLVPDPADCNHANTVRAQMNVIEVDP